MIRILVFSMEMPGRRSDYTFLSQIPDEEIGTGPSTSFFGSIAAEANISKGRTDRVFDWDGSGDHKLNTQANRIGNQYSWIGLQRHSSGSSYDDSSLSSDYYPPTLSNAAANEINALGYIHDDEFRVKAVGSGGSSGKSWAQQTEESYQLQLALALRLSSEATCADDPNFMDLMPDEAASRSLSSSAEAISHRFWVNGCMSYFEKVPDGLYLIHGMDPYVWSLCTNLKEDGRIPSFESLKTVDFSIRSSIEVVFIDRHSDASLKELQKRVHNISSSCITTEEVADHLAKLVCNHMGGSVSEGEDALVPSWRECSDDLKECLGSVVIPLCSLSVGLCKHRAVLFKVLADSIDLPCRIARGCKYCTRDDASSCLVRFGLDREYVIDLIGKPGCLCEPDCLLNGPSSISISSPLRFPRLKPIESNIDFRSLAKQYFLDSQSLNIVFDEASSGNVVSGKDTACSVYQRPFNRKDVHGKNIVLAGDRDRSPQLMNPKVTQRNAQDGKSEQFRSCDSTAQHSVQSTPFVENVVRLNQISQIDSRDSEPLLALPCLRMDPANNLSFIDGNRLVKKPNQLSFGIEDFVIPWNDLILREKIGAGSFGTVYHADWHGSDVAVKILMEQDLNAERFEEFLREVAIMKSLRHPNIVLFMGAVTEPPNLSIVTEYLSRGSLHRLLHRPGAREVLDERRRLNMAHDVAKGMNYLHKRNPPIVHRDLKSPNILVDKKYTVKICDFGLSRLKAHTFLSSKSAAGTPEWMAPEVLRDEPSNEKSDVYSFGVILWELASLQQPWGNLNPAQVVAAVGFKGKRLEIPRDLNPQVATIIEACFASEPWKRPSFYEIMESLKPLIKPATPNQVRPNMSLVAQ